MTRLLIIAFILTSLSFSKKTINNELYFSFDNIALTLLSEMKLNDTLKFVGTNNTRQEYKIYKIEKTKEPVQECNWNTGACKIYYYFDKIQFYFIRTDTVIVSPNSPLTYTLNLQMQIPITVDKKNIPKDIKVKASIFGNSFINFNAIPVNAVFILKSFLNYLYSKK